MISIRARLCKMFCHHHSVPQDEIDRRAALPMEFRNVSHSISNAVMEHALAAANIRKETNAFLELVEAIARDNRRQH